ncbi:toll/interleukin-1 receptor domain-containing protein [Streptomyces triticirhizae]|uniref:toll/interleukin-1 receptor domain-containing protein n=1 Tax=Streptomyces triticirhizae TaxID=2483353 RepID=UPI001F4060E3|nr:toll/interleukin-1 receptor domain-containing protein [Streptomyces triticirhizae]
MVTAGSTQAEWDVFVSYSRSDARRIDGVLPALRAAGLRVFVDDTAVDDFASITATIREALARCKVLLAFYSVDYPRRRACQWELTYAYLTGQHEGDPLRRTLLVNPERSAEHVHPVELRDARHWPWPRDREGVEQLAARVAEYARGIETPMGDLAGTPPVAWLPAPARTGSSRFTGRLAEQWRVHTALHRHRAPLVSGTGAGRIAQLRGMPGIGKSLLAQEYALHFSSSFPGGVFWFDVHQPQASGAGAAGADASGAEEVVRAYAEQLATALSALGVVPTDTSPAGLLSHFAVALGERNAPCLWVVDGGPDGLSPERLHLLRGPHLLCATLVTTRSLRYGAFAEPIDLAPIEEADGYRLLTSRRPPRDDLDRAAALALVRDVDGHPATLELLAELAERGDFGRLRNRFHGSGGDVLTSRRPPGGGAESFLARPLSGELLTDDVLRLLALASPAPLSRSTLENVLATAGPYDPWDLDSLVGGAVETLEGTGAVRPVPSEEWSWTVHPVLARAVRRHDGDTARLEDLRRILLHHLTPALTPARARPPAPSEATANGAVPNGASANGTSANGASANGAAASGAVPPNGATPAGAAPAARWVRQPTTTGTIERAAAFDLQIELVTRVGVQRLGPEQGSLREALDSLYALFGVTRDVLHRMSGETVGPRVLPGVALRVANEHLRPFLSTWHPALQAWEATRPPGTGAVEHEQRWADAPRIRAELAELAEPLTSAARELAGLCGIDLVGD